jgi:hypothetical protein
MLIAVACTVESRFSAVTTISSSPVSPPPSAAAAANAGRYSPLAQRSDAAAMEAVDQRFFMFITPSMSSYSAFITSLNS